MNAIRPDETLDNLHSLYVDQWDWEKVVAPEQRTVPFLKETVRAIYGVIQRTEKYICFEYAGLTSVLPTEITFIHSEELEAQYPGLAPAAYNRGRDRPVPAVHVLPAQSAYRGDSSQHLAG
jgi:aspartate--ammonia ligase